VLPLREASEWQPQNSLQEGTGSGI
jgi:hypothetical protein